MTSLLDMLKEVDLRIHFTQHFKSTRSREAMDPRTLQRRLLLCLYRLGSNTGRKRICAGQSGEDYQDLLYVRRHYLAKDQLRSAITDVVNALFHTRLTNIWGEGTTACASDSKKFSAGIRTYSRNGISAIAGQALWSTGTLTARRKCIQKIEYALRK